jgi:hypothetical protein
MGAHRESGQYRILRQRTRLSPRSILDGLMTARLLRPGDSLSIPLRRWRRLAGLPEPILLRVFSCPISPRGLGLRSFLRPGLPDCFLFLRGRRDLPVSSTFMVGPITSAPRFLRRSPEKPASPFTTIHLPRTISSRQSCYWGELGLRCRYPNSVFCRTADQSGCFGAAR